MKLFTRKKNDRAQDRFHKLLDAGDLPTFPKVVADAIQQIACADIHLSEVAATIATDPKLTVDALRLANSPAFAPRSPITSVHQAVVLLGRNQLESLLIASGVAEAMPTEEAPCYSPRVFWTGAAHRATAAAGLAAVVAPGTQYDKFTAVLLQDMAQPILLHHDPSYVELVAASAGCHHELAALERATLGWTHAEIGELMCIHWGLPQALSASVSSHHSEPVEGFEIAQWAALLAGQDTDLDFVVDDAIRRFGVEADLVRSILADAMDRATEMASVFV